MPLSKTTVAELTDELQQLERRKREIEERMGAIVLVLQGQRAAPPVAPRRVLLHDRIAAAQADPEKAVGVRGHLKNALRQHGPMLPREAIVALEGANIQTTGKTTVALRIYNELHRMKRLEMVKKNSDGRYELTA